MKKQQCVEGDGGSQKAIFLVPVLEFYAPTMLIALLSNMIDSSHMQLLKPGNVAFLH